MRAAPRTDPDQALTKEARDRLHERQVWARQLRYQTHVQFLVEFAVLHDAAMQLDIARQLEATPATQPTIAMMAAVNIQLTMLELLAEPSTHEKAWAAFDALRDYSDGRSDHERVITLRSEYVAAVRAESTVGPFASPATAEPAG